MLCLFLKVSMSSHFVLGSKNWPEREPRARKQAFLFNKNQYNMLKANHNCKKLDLDIRGVVANIEKY